MFAIRAGKRRSGIVYSRTGRRHDACSRSTVPAAYRLPNPIGVGDEERGSLLSITSSSAIARLMASIVSWILTKFSRRHSVSPRMFC